MSNSVLTGQADVMRAINNTIAKLGNGHVDIGFMEGATYPATKDGDKPLSVAQVAFWNEFGTATAPPRPFFRRMIAAEQSHWAKDVTVLTAKTQGNGAQVLHMMGALIEGELKKSINDFVSPALSPNTRKKSAKAGFDKPLIDTGHMLNSITSEVHS